MSEIFTPIRTIDEISSDITDVIEMIFDGYYADEPRIDWHDFLNRIELTAHVDLGSDMDSPVVKEIRKIVKKLRATS